MTPTMPIAILARAPLPGQTKTRLIPALGADGAAQLQAQLIAHSVAKCAQAALGPVTLFATHDLAHPLFERIAAYHDIALARQCDGDLGARMAHALAHMQGPALLIGTDCPALNASHLRACAAALVDGHDAVVIGAEDGGYVLIGTRTPQPALFDNMTWGTPDVLSETLMRGAKTRLSMTVVTTLWDVDTPSDLARLRASPLAAQVIADYAALDLGA